MAIGHSKRHQATIDGEVCDLIISHKSKTVWIARGSFRGRHISGSGDSESAAFSDWIKQANIEANI